MISTHSIPKPMRRPLLRSFDPGTRNITSADALLRYASRTLDKLRCLLQSLPGDVAGKFIAAYSQHYAYSVNHGERPAEPLGYYNEWKQVQEIGQIPINTEKPIYDRRHYNVYDTPSDVYVKREKRNGWQRAKARKVLGLDAGSDETPTRAIARRVL